MKIPQWIIEFWAFITSAELGTLASLAGAGVSIWVLISVRAIRKHFLFTARIPQILEDLQSNASTLNTGIADFDASREMIDVELARCHANLLNLSSKIGGNTKKNVRKLTEAIEKYHAGDKKRETARHIYTLLNGLMQQIKNLREDTKWGDTNAG